LTGDATWWLDEAKALAVRVGGCRYQCGVACVTAVVESYQSLGVSAVLQKYRRQKQKVVD
jgi:hypothetical protein